MKPNLDIVELNSVISLVISMLLSLEGVWYDRILFKFKENKLEKTQ